MLANRGERLTHHHIGIVPKVQPGMALAGLAPVDHVDLESTGCHVARQAAVGHQVEGFGGHRQGRNQDQRNLVGWTFDGKAAPVGEFHRLLVLEIVETNRHGIALMDRLEGSSSRLNQFITIENPVESVEQGKRKAVIDFQTLVQSSLQKGNHDLSSVCWRWGNPPG